ncbi:MAG: SDR family NAD(P)-dependent oxidoreductase, partial [Bacteroidota bacterium]
INNAGFVLSGPFENSTEEQIRRQMEVNFFGCILMIKQLLPALKAVPQSTIVNVSSLCGLMAFPMLSMYHASKWALEGFSESLWYELEPLGVRVKLIEPGGIKENNYSVNVELVKEVSSDYEGLLNRVHHSEWFPSFTQPDEVAAAIYKASTDPSNRLRYRIGNDCELLLNERMDHMNGEQYIQKIKERIIS